MTTALLEKEITYIENTLQENELTHLKVSKRGDNIVIYSEGVNGKENRCRFINKKRGMFNLNMANHTGRWEPTPFEGSLEELLEMVIGQFPWTLTNYEQDNGIL